MQDMGPILAGLAVFAGIPLILWAEAWLRGTAWFRRVATGLLVLWMCALGLVMLQEWLCEGSSIKGFTACAVPVAGDVLQGFPALLGFPLALGGYGAALAVRIGAALWHWMRVRAI